LSATAPHPTKRRIAVRDLLTGFAVRVEIYGMSPPVQVSAARNDDLTGAPAAGGEKRQAEIASACSTTPVPRAMGFGDAACGTIRDRYPSSRNTTYTFRHEVAKGISRLSHPRFQRLRLGKKATPTTLA